ncbi:serine/threonine-protein kinase [Nocardioides sp.]|uniref:serine/threonine-protein kinase n=1 Tax=Nocardioides sp. TaxID=35761 RepID=UPI003513410C
MSVGDRDAHEDDPAPSHALGSRYRLVEQLGSGAMGTVWRTQDRLGGGFVAAKLLRPELTHDPDLVGRFVQERAILLSLSHPAIVRVHDLVVEGERLAIVMDLVEGGDLRRHLRTAGTMRPAEAVDVVCAVLDALAAAHAGGCLHRDVKPDNVLLAPEGGSLAQRVRLTDFGIARLAQDSSVQATGLLGTPGYMPPELFAEGRFGPASDVYACGIMLYELLGGRTPFAGQGTAHTVGFRHITSAPPPLPVAPALWAQVARMLAKDPAQRGSAAAAAGMLRDLRAGIGEDPAVPRQPEPVSWAPSPDSMPPGGSWPGSWPGPPPVGPPGGGRTVVRGAGVSTGGVPSGGVPSGGVPSGMPSGAWGPPPPMSAPPAPVRRSRAGVLAAAAAAVAGVVVAAVLVGGALGRDGAGADTASVGPDDDPRLATGLVIGHAARLDDGEVTYTATLSAGREPLAGRVLLALPLPTQASCTSWFRSDDVALQVPGETRTTARCAGVVDLDLDPEDRTEVSVRFTPDWDAAQAATRLADWVSDVRAETTEALDGLADADTDFAAQRLQGLCVEFSPDPVRTGDTAEVVLHPDWGRGCADAVVLYTSSPVEQRPVIDDVSRGRDAVVLNTGGCSSARVVRTRVAAESTGSCEVTVSLGREGLAGTGTLDVLR